MPLPGAHYRYKKGTKIRLAFGPNGEVEEAKNMETGATHTLDEFKADHARAARKHAISKKLKGGR